MYSKYTMTDIRKEILQSHAEKLSFNRKIHGSNLYTGITLSPVLANPNMSASRLLCRHLSTVLLYLNEKMIEVQVAVNHQKKILYISSNSQKKFMERILPKTLKELSVPDDILAKYKREKRHAQKLLVEKLTYGDYELKYIWKRDKQHAETKIIDEIGDDFDYIAGTKRPCVACWFHMKLNKISSEKYNNHHGAYWDSDSALLSLTRYVGQIFQINLDKCFFFNEKSNPKEQYKYDTDSENED